MNHRVWLKKAPLFLLLGFVVICRFLPIWAESYMKHIYPLTSKLLSVLSSTIPFSITEIFVVSFCLWMVAYPIVMRSRKNDKMPWKRIGKKMLHLMAWLYVWFYLGWGVSYYRLPLYQRVGYTALPYEQEELACYIKQYVEELNNTYVPELTVEKEVIHAEITALYGSVGRAYGLVAADKIQRPKRLLFNRLYCSAMVGGYISPFFGEIQINKACFPAEYPFVYAHELSHFLGISSEAEANYWAFQICSHSRYPEIRYSAYLSILPYLSKNIAALLPKEEFEEWYSTIRPEIKEDLYKRDQLWLSHYNPLIGRVQQGIYTMLLKGNKISSGTQNYSEVVGLLLHLKDVDPMQSQKGLVKKTVK